MASSLDERRLTASRSRRCERWFEGGAVEGDPALLPRAADMDGEWQLGTPDLVIETRSLHAARLRR